MKSLSTSWSGTTHKIWHELSSILLSAPTPCSSPLGKEAEHDSFGLTKTAASSGINKGRNKDQIIKGPRWRLLQRFFHNSVLAHVTGTKIPMSWKLYLVVAGLSNANDSVILLGVFLHHHQNINHTECSAAVASHLMFIPLLSCVSPLLGYYLQEQYLQQCIQPYREPKLIVCIW